MTTLIWPSLTNEGAIEHARATATPHQVACSMAVMTHLLCHHLGQVAVVHLHQPVTLLELVLGKLGGHAVSAGAPGEALEQVADDADGVLFFLLLTGLLTLLVLHLQVPCCSGVWLVPVSGEVCHICLATGQYEDVFDASVVEALAQDYRYDTVHKLAYVQTTV